MEESYNNFLEEIKGKIEDYIEYSNKNSENEFNNTQVEELKQKMEQEKRNEIKGIIDSYRQKMEQDIDEKRHVLAEKMQESIEFVVGISEKIKNVNAFKKLAKETKYTAESDSTKEQIKSIKERWEEYSAKLDEYSSMEEEFDEAKKELESFDSIFANIDFNSDQGIYDLRDIVEKAKTVEELGHEENEGKTAIPKLSEEDVEVTKPKKILTMEDIKNEEIRDDEIRKVEEEEMPKKDKEEKLKSQKKAEDVTRKILTNSEKYKKQEDKERKQEEEKRVKREISKEEKAKEKVFHDLERGVEDLLVLDYKLMKAAFLNKYTSKELETALSGKDITDIYKALLNKAEPAQKEKIEEAIAKIEKRREFTKDFNEGFGKWENDYKDLLTPEYYNWREKALKAYIHMLENGQEEKAYSNINRPRNILKVYEGLLNRENDPTKRKEIEKTIQLIKQRQAELAKKAKEGKGDGTKDNSGTGNPQPKNPPKNPQPTRAAEGNPKPDNLQNGEAKVFQQTRIAILPYENKVGICIKGEKEPLYFSNIEELRNRGEFLKGLMVSEYPKGRKAAEPLMLAIFEKIGRYAEWSEMYAGALEGKEKSPVNRILYDLENSSGVDFQNKKMITDIAKLAKNAEKQGLAQIKFPKRQEMGFWDKIKDFFGKILHKKGSNMQNQLGRGVIENSGYKVNDYIKKGAPTLEEQAKFAAQFTNRKGNTKQKEPIQR